MIEVLTDMHEGVLGLQGSGRLQGEDLRGIEPALEQMLTTGEIRIVEIITSDYEGFGRGGLVEDLKFGLGSVVKHHGSFKRIAVVTDKDWVAHTLHALAWMVPGEIALFGLDDIDRAKKWAAG